MQYRLTLSTAQARAADKAIELLLRLKIGQYDVIPENVMDMTADVDSYCKHRDAAKPHLAALQRVFETYYHKDDEWHRLYDLHQVIRKAIHDAEHPGTVGVDSYPVVCTAGEKMARMEVVTDAAKAE